MRRVLLAAALLLSGCGGADAPSGPRTGAQVFAQEGCGGCHVLAAAGATGTAGPSLDGGSRSAADVERWVREGGAGMPAYEDRLSGADIVAVARYVAGGGR